MPESKTCFPPTKLFIVTKKSNICFRDGLKFQFGMKSINPFNRIFHADTPEKRVGLNSTGLLTCGV